MMEVSRRIIMYCHDEMEPDDVERWAARYGFIVTNPQLHGQQCRLIHPDGTEFVAPEGTQIWVSDLIASEHDNEEEAS
jgi:hypothetical protein